MVQRAIGQRARCAFHREPRCHQHRVGCRMNRLKQERLWHVAKSSGRATARRAMARRDTARRDTARRASTDNIGQAKEILSQIHRAIVGDEHIRLVVNAE